MGTIVLLSPWIACIILLLLYKKQKKLRSQENDIARQTIHNLETKYENEINLAKTSATRQIGAVKQEAAQQIEAIKLETSKKITEVEILSQSEINTIRVQAAQKIRETREAIQAAKENMLALDEKDLLIEAILAIKTLSQRLDRIENRLSNLAISLNSQNQATSAKEKKVYSHTGFVTDDELIEIVQQAAKPINRLVDVTVEDAIICGLVISLQKKSTWSFKIDFNDNGVLTGRYEIFSNNEDSTIPELLAKEVAKEILFRLNT